MKAEQKFRSLVEHSTDVITIVDPSLRIEFANGGVENLFGADPKSVVGQPLSAFVSLADLDGLRRVLTTDLLPGRSEVFHRDVALVRLDGKVRWVSLNVTNHLDTPNINGWVLNVHDVTERKEAEAALSQLAMHDALTGLPNRTQMRMRLDKSLSEAPGRTALLFCDLDGFKAVNDRLGHEMGDEVLRGVAGRWSSQLRAHDVLGRWGGDEFLVICPDVKGLDQVTLIAERLLTALSDPIYLAGGHAQLGTSIGVALHDGVEGIDDLIARADSAMYAAKRVDGGIRLA